MEGDDRDSGFVAKLAAPDREALRSLGHRRRYPRGASVFLEGDHTSHVLVLVEGRVKVHVSTADGREIVLAMRGPGDLLGELAAVDGSDTPRSAAATALEPVVAQVLAPDEFTRFLETSPRAALVLLRTLTRRLRDADRTRVEFGSSGTVARVAARLVELAEDHGQPGPGGLLIGVPLTQVELAGWVGASREAVVRALSTLRTGGLLTTGRRAITVLDLDGLRALAD